MSKLSNLYQWYVKSVPPGVDMLSPDAFRYLNYHERLRLAGVKVKINPKIRSLCCSELSNYFTGMTFTLDRLPTSMRVIADDDIYLRGTDGELYAIYPFEYILIPPDSEISEKSLPA
jgi:hypothetical protein